MKHMWGRLPRLGTSFLSCHCCPIDLGSGWEERAPWLKSREARYWWPVNWVKCHRCMLNPNIIKPLGSFRLKSKSNPADDLNRLDGTIMQNSSVSVLKIWNPALFGGRGCFCAWPHCCYCCTFVCLCACVYKSALTSSITSSGLWEPGGEPHQPPLWWRHTWFMAFRGPFVFITPRRQPAVASWCFTYNTSTFWVPEREERMSRGDVFSFFWHWRETKGLDFGYKEEKLGPGCRLHFPPLAGFRGGRGGIMCQCLGKVVIAKRVQRSQKVRSR